MSRHRFVAMLVGVLLCAPVPCAQQTYAQQEPGLPGPLESVAPAEPGNLGIAFSSLSDQAVEALHLGQPHALLVEVPTSGGPADKAGLLPGDVVLELDGAAVTTTETFTATLRKFGKGADARLALLRGGDRLTLSVRLGGLLDAQRLATDPQTSIEKPERDIAAYESILIVFTRVRFPREWAQSQTNLGYAYRHRIQGDRAYNLEKAIAAFEAALTIYTRETLPIEWARTQNSLGIIYDERVRGDRADNLEKAIASYEAALSQQTRDAKSIDWAATQNNLGNAYTLRIRGDRAGNLEKAIAAFEMALSVRTREALPNDWAATQINLGNAYLNRISGDRAANLEKSIGTYEAALTVQTREAKPIDWAMTQNNLGLAYTLRIRGDRAGNLERSIAAFDAALTVRTRQALPIDWAATLTNLGEAYRLRIQGDRADNLERGLAAYEGALSVRTREALPIDWATTQNNLGVTYYDRVRGDRASNLDLAITAYEAALTVLTRESTPIDWATVQNSLGAAYGGRIHGNQADNQERALAAYEAALSVRTRVALPNMWAATQTNLGIDYTQRIRGDRADNMEKAIIAFEAALSVLTREVSPIEWATIQNNLGNAYRLRIRGDRFDNLEKAITAFEAALTVQTREALPIDWAGTQGNLGIAYSERIRGDRSDNLDRAITAYESILTVFTRETLPVDWARTQNNLGAVYSDRIRGNRASNLAKAVAAYQAALTINTRQALPRENFRASRQLAIRLFETHHWDSAASAYTSARDTFLLLLGQGLDEAEARDVINSAGPLFSEAAYTAAQRSDLATALALSSEGRAQLMAITMRLNTVDLPPDKRRRLDELRTGIREADRSLDAARGSDRTAALDRLAGLRDELLNIVKAATAAKNQPALVLAAAGRLVAKGDAIVVPVVTQFGGKLLIVTRGKHGPVLSAVDLPDLSTQHVDEVMRGASSKTGDIGWLGAFHLQDLSDPTERRRRFPEWVHAIETIGQSEWQLFAGALDTELRTRGVKPGARVIILPTGSLGLLPLSLAQDTVTGRRFGDVYEVVEAPSLEALTAASKQIAKPMLPTLAAIVNPTGLNAQLALPFTETEGAMVEAFFSRNGTSILDKTDATPDAVLAGLKGKSYWHFSSHGYFDWSDPRNSGLVLKDKAPLTVSRLIEQQSALGKPRLVVLSACETGLYDTDRTPDEFVGLPATFMQLGASGVISSLWQVNDLATSLLMAKFYDYHRGGGFRPSAALKLAQSWLRNATMAEFSVFLKTESSSGRLSNTQAAEMLDALDPHSRSYVGRSLPDWDALHDRGNVDTLPGTIGSLNNADLRSRPFAHPYFWGAFFYMGL